ncbi:Bug family tripartite tricarboxylate transporter substrate binding protein [Comamonas composti]|uniref:Bug family tripartite tricarboxylate transporter substrate binding protein n=1 Tax=Comamonas composti TaxID=408558 RepID=UPI00041E0FE5|nr:tripartite tricarboxylate transporter substrate binding protein [Comamonas composti]
MKSVFTALTAISMMFAGGLATAQDYPQKGKPLTMIVPFAPGGASDLLVRLIGQKLGEQWETPVVVQNKPGGDMVIAMQTVARAEKDGYTMGLTTSSFALNKVVKKNFPMDPINDLASIGMVGQSAYVLAVDNSSPYKSFKELEAAARDNKNKFSYASCCFGTYFAAEMIKTATNLQGVHVPYKGSSPALNAMLSKEVEYIIDTTTATKPFITSGKLRPLMVTGRKRSPSFPDVPHLGEAGVPGDFEVGVWYGLVFPAGTPAEIVNKTNATLNKILAMPDVKSRIEGFDIEVTPSSPEKMSQKIVEDLNKYVSAAKKANLDFSNQ